MFFVFGTYTEGFVVDREHSTQEMGLNHLNELFGVFTLGVDKYSYRCVHNGSVKGTVWEGKTSGLSQTSETPAPERTV